MQFFSVLMFVLAGFCFGYPVGKFVNGKQIYVDILEDQKAQIHTAKFECKRLPDIHDGSGKGWSH